MIHTFKKGSYKLSAAAILLIVALGAIFLNMASDDGKSAELGTTDQAASPNRELSPVYDDLFSWFSSLDRALEFPKYDFKVPDYLPDGYQLENILYSKNFSNSERTDLIDVVSISFVTNFGTENEKRIEMIASKGRGNLLEYNQLWGANYPHHNANAKETAKYRQKAVVIGHTEGTLFTDKRTLKKKPETSKSFYWQDDSVWYAINYYNEHLSQEDLTKMVKSFVFPQQVQHIRYDGEGNSFVLYDEKDLLAAKNILDLKVKIPTKLSKLAINYSMLLKADDQNTNYGFRQVTDTLWTEYTPTRDSLMYGVSNYLSLYQSKEPLFDASKLTFTRKLEIDGVGISAYEDQKHIYVIPDKKRKWPIYLWKQDDIYYTAVFSGIDKDQEDNLKEIISAPLR